MTSADITEAEGRFERLGYFDQLHEHIGGEGGNGYFIVSFDPQADPPHTVELNGWIYSGHTFSEAAEHALNDDVPPIDEQEDTA